MKSELAQALAGIAVKLSPPAGVIGGAVLFDIDWQEWVWIVTFLYVGLQLALLAWDRLAKPLIARLRKD